ncbi:hypothetical protein AT4G10843 [Arabidopsis thaliana]|uniref:Uncharacterized protein n=1 Tax=Arabidopsis thaliana TaxID=3702 RepID=A0A1P8B5G1_ARATH|nr:uncharacterized protein AT4G10843 [Arabidopsis thaliana]ANM66823.1 hypothetical protein AT4G10843 [Arabidopsis thaliana]|eukprot:NP_001328695.1 hypothetical protein AT4G10843 [Arabidopsis thaliana]
MKLRRKRWSWLVIETKSLKSSLPERRRRRRFIFALCDSSFLLDVNLFTFWTEETLIEDKSLSFCTCNGERWRRLFSFYKLLMILKETSDMENLLQMVHLSVNKFVFSTGKELENIEQEKELDQHVVNLKFPVLIYQPTTNSLIYRNGALKWLCIILMEF